MSEWFTFVPPETPLNQGDLIVDCPLIGWDPTPLTTTGSDETEVLKKHVQAIKADVVVMTQACDLEQNRVRNVILCPTLPVSDYRQVWVTGRQSEGKKHSADAWKSYLHNLNNGFVWNATILSAADIDGLFAPSRVVDFHEVFSTPREFLESLLKQRGRRRLRLLPPYREHLSQSFARFFMRVGLPVPVTIEATMRQVIIENPVVNSPHPTPP